MVTTETTPVTSRQCSEPSQEHHKIIEWFGLEGIFEDYPVPTPATGRDVIQ